MPKKAPPLGQPSPRWRFPPLVLLLVASLVLLFLFGEQVFAFLRGIGEWLLSTFGLGLALIALAILAVLAFKGWLLLLRRWHRWMGMAVLSLAMFGVLSFFRLDWKPLQNTVGGWLGQRITGPSVGLGVVRVALLIYLGLLLLAPATTVSWTQASMRAIGKGIGVAGRGAKVLLVAAGQAAISLFRALLWPLRAGIRGGQRLLAAAPRPEGTEATPQAAPSPLAPPSAPPPSLKAEEPPPREAYPSPKEAGRPAEGPGEPRPEQPVITPSGWELPTLNILDPIAAGTFGPGDVERRAETLQKALAEYGVEARVVGWNIGPTVTQFEVEPGWDVKSREMKEKDTEGGIHISRQEVSRTRVKVDRITALGNDLALALAAPSIRIEAPVPGKSIVGIEVPNTSLDVVPLRSVLESPQFQRLRSRTKLAVSLGKGVGGEALVADLARMPHLLIAGATGSGKSVCINTLICCLALYNTPEELKMVLIDPKRVEFTSFHTLPHLAMPVVVDREKAVEALRWLVREMDSRYKALAGAGARNIGEYNRTQHPKWPLPYIVLFVDELADLMTVAFDETEKNLCRLAQLARATGIHLVVATQRPSVDVVTGLIKANFPTRISFALSSQVDSRTILDTAGAEKLLGRGDMLYLPTDSPKPKRLQGCFVSDAEIERLVASWRRQRRVVLTAPQPAPTEPYMPGGAAPQESPPPADPLLDAARRLAREHHHISTSFLQRRLQIGSNKAVKLMELLEEEGTITGGEKKAETQE